MVVNHLRIDYILSLPTENNAPLIIDPQAPEPRPITFAYMAFNGLICSCFNPFIGQQTLPQDSLIMNSPRTG
jgi:hypothetical protein